MATLVLFLLALIVVGGLFFVLASVVVGRGEEMAPAPPDSTPVELPDDHPVRGADVRALRLSMVLRGYRMGEVDWVLEQLARTIDERDGRLAELERELGELRARPAPEEAVFVGPLPPVLEREPADG